MELTTTPPPAHISAEVAQLIEPIAKALNNAKRLLAQIHVQSAEDDASMAIAKSLRLQIRQARLGATEAIKARRTEVQNRMEADKAEDTFWLRLLQAIDATAKALEAEAKAKEDTAINIAAAAREERTSTRMAKALAIRPGTHRGEVQDLSDLEWLEWLEEAEAEAKALAEAKAIAEVKAKAEAEALANAREEAQAAKNALAQAQAEAQAAKNALAKAQAPAMPVATSHQQAARQIIEQLKAVHIPEAASPGIRSGVSKMLGSMIAWIEKNTP
jgi:colicin import membrane protein